MSIRDAMEKDIRQLVDPEGPTPCGPIMVRLSWHDAGVYSNNKSKGLQGGCPNAAMRHTSGGEGTFGANNGLPTVAIGLLKEITQKYCPKYIGHADLWALAANVSIEMYGGPKIPMFFGRKDAVSHEESVETQVGRLPDGDKGACHLRDIFYPKGFSDRDIVALSGAHTLGHCHKDRSGFDGPWTDNPLKFDNSYFVDLLSRKWEREIVPESGNTQYRNKATGTMMLISDMALVEDASFRPYVELYAKDQHQFFTDFADAWARLQILGYDRSKLSESITSASI